MLNTDRFIWYGYDWLSDTTILDNIDIEKYSPMKFVDKHFFCLEMGNRGFKSQFKLQLDLQLLPTSAGQTASFFATLMWGILKFSINFSWTLWYKTPRNALHVTNTNTNICKWTLVLRNKKGPPTSNGHSIEQRVCVSLTDTMKSVRQKPSRNVILVCIYHVKKGGQHITVVRNAGSG